MKKRSMFTWIIALLMVSVLTVQAGEGGESPASFFTSFIESILSFLNTVAFFIPESLQGIVQAVVTFLESLVAA